MPLALVEDMAHRRAERDDEVAAPPEVVPGDGNDSFNERLVILDRALYCVRCRNVLHLDAEVGGSARVADLDAGEPPYERPCGSGRVARLEDSYDDVIALGDGRLYGLGRLLLVVLDGDEGNLRLQDVLQDPDSLDDFRGLFAHQAVIAGDIGLAFGSVDDEDMGLSHSPSDLLVRRKPRSAHAGDAGGVDDGEQLVRCLCPEVRNGMPLPPLILPVRSDGDFKILET